jgi:hypothetical protein
MSNDEFLSAMRADLIPEGESGLWKVSKFRMAKEFQTKDGDGRMQTLQPGCYTSLTRWTDATIHLRHGELVMHDFPYELRKHLIFARRAHGKVLITGLGLGCIARGCLANPNVDHVVVIENSPDVLKLVAPFMPKTKIEIIYADAIEWTAKHGDGFDCAWHDLWAEEKEGSKHLQLLHTEMLCNLANKVPLQGAWELPRAYRRLMRDYGIL